MIVLLLLFAVATSAGLGWALHGLVDELRECDWCERRRVEGSWACPDHGGSAVRP